MTHRRRRLECSYPNVGSAWQRFTLEVNLTSRSDMETHGSNVSPTLDDHLSVNVASVTGSSYHVVCEVQEV
jgi:CO/xanthine dehydrogenase Mo-binding subunit